jgi:hypothetical protein
MSSRVALLVLALWSFSSLAEAQTIVVVEPPPPPPVIVVVEPPPPAQVVIVEERPPAPPPAPAPAPTPAPAPAPGWPTRWLLDVRGDLLFGAGYDGAVGGTAALGLTFAHGYVAQLAVGYASGALGFRQPSEVSLGVELQRDFSPDDPIGFLLVGRVGTAFLLDDLPIDDAGIRLSGQLGIGGRFDMGSDVAMIMDVRGVLRFRPDRPFGPTQDDLSAGVLFSLGIRVRL